MKASTSFVACYGNPRIPTMAQRERVRDAQCWALLGGWVAGWLAGWVAGGCFGIKIWTRWRRDCSVDGRRLRARRSVVAVVDRFITGRWQRAKMAAATRWSGRSTPTPSSDTAKPKLDSRRPCFFLFLIIVDSVFFDSAFASFGFSSSEFRPRFYADKNWIPSDLFMADCSGLLCYGSIGLIWSVSLLFIGFDWVDLEFPVFFKTWLNFTRFR